MTNIWGEVDTHTIHPLNCVCFALQVKVRLQAQSEHLDLRQSHKYKGVVDAFRSIVREKGNDTLAHTPLACGHVMFGFGANTPLLPHAIGGG